MVGGLFGHNPLLDYRLPETNIHWWSVDIDPDTFMVVGTGERLRLSGSAEPRYSLLRINEREYIAIVSGLSASGAVSRGYSASVAPHVDADVDWYPTRLPVSMGTRSYLSGEVGREHEPGYWADSVQARFSSKESRASPLVWVPSYDGNSWSVRTESELGPAFGRLRDATPVLQALLIGEVLADEKLLSGPMTGGAVQSLARALAGGNQVYYSHDANHGTKFYYAELERILAATGCINGRLPARAWLRIREIVGRQPLLDDRSWLTGAKLSVRGGINAYLERHYYDREGQRGSDTTAYADLFGTAALEFGYPFTTRLHLSGGAEVQQGPQTGRLDATADMALSYLLPDRMQVRAEGQCRLTRENPNPAEPVQIFESASAGVDLITYVEDLSVLDFGISYSGRAWQPAASSPWQRSWGLGCNISLRRYF
jgi:hypothetical protein